MQYENSYRKMTLLKANISTAERDQAKAIAKSKGMTFAGWLGMAVREAMRKEQEVRDDA